MIGCSGTDSGPFPQWLPETAPGAASPAFTELRSLGEQANALLEAAHLGPKSKPRDRERLKTNLAPLVGRLEVLCRQPIAFEFQPAVTLLPLPARGGWAALGDALAAEELDAIQVENFDRAIELAIAETNFGYCLVGGDADDALTGLPLINAARQPLGPKLTSLSPSQLARLESGMASALRQRPSMAVTAGHERLSMLASLQAVQNAYRDNQLDGVLAQLGSGVKEAVQALKDARNHGSHAREIFFQSMADQAEAEAGWLMACADKPAITRPAEPEFKSSPKRPWVGLAKQFTLTGAPLLSTDDAALARLRLLILTCDLLRTVKTQGGSPNKLNPKLAGYNVDPYTGEPFIYVAKGHDFSLYSVGADGVDNGGDTDTSFTLPDLFLEGFR